MTSAPSSRTVRTRRPRAGTRAAIWVGSALVIAAFGLPLWSFLASAFDATASARLRLWPSQPSLANVVDALREGFLGNVGLSVAVSALSVVIGLAVASTAAFAFVHYRSRLTGVLFTVVVASFLLPFEALSVPLVLVFDRVGLTDSLFALVLPGVANGLAIFAVTTAYRAVPLEVVEAARLDGAGSWRIYRSIYLPLGASSLVGAGVLIFAAQWNAYLWPLLAASSDAMKTASVVLAENSGSRTTDYGGTYAEVLLLSLIPIVVLLFAQRRLDSAFSTKGSS